MKHLPRKRFGQNFLTDKGVLQNIIHTINPQPDDSMVEIGPGLAAMTRLLLQGVSQLHAVELDRDLVARLGQEFQAQEFHAPKLIVHAADALQFDFLQIPVAPGKKLRVVGNLPYNISSPLLFHLAEIASHVQDQHFMLQKEVVERMVAEPGSKAYGRLSVMLQWQYHMELMFLVPPSAFDPPPKVDSAIVRMIPKKNPLLCQSRHLQTTVAKAFSQRRKVIKNCLAGLFTETQLTQAGINPQQRPETISLEAYVALANLLEK